ncbi:MAG: glycosyltransferase family 2 protein [Chloroflexi bacterium]|nr:glycosyltransferase family 2 protein [Chloroflexota bacterium]
MPTVSVVIPTYNRAGYILDAIESVLSQTYSDYEIIVVDDGSADHTRDMLQPLIADDKIRYVYQENQGVSAARNHGIRLAQGEYIAFLDSDDLFLPTKLEKQVAVLERSLTVAFVHAGYEKISDTGTCLGYRDTSKISGQVSPQILLDWSVLIATPCVLVRKSVLDEVGDFDESMRWAEDLDLWRRIAQRYEIGVIPEMLCQVRVHPGGASVSKVEAAASFERYLQKAFVDAPQLSKLFQHRAWAKLYSNLGHNILAESGQEQMTVVRQYSMKAIRQWPFQWSAYLGWLGSFISLELRNWLLTLWRNYRDRR